jgi:DNA repair exonuclease SbcCD ATPase subunit
MFKYKKLYLAQKNENEALAVENSLLRKASTDMNGAVQRSADEIANLTRQLTDKQIEFDRAKENETALRDELSSKQLVVEDLGKKLDEARAKFASAADASEHWMKQAGELESKLKAKEKARSVATANLKKETEANAALREEIAKLTAEIIELKNQLTSLLEDNENLEHDLSTLAEDGSSIRGKCAGCKFEGNYRKCTSCLRGHAEDKYTPVEPEISSSTDDGNSTNEETIVEEGAIVGEPVNMEDVPLDADVAELKEMEIEMDTVPDAEPTSDMDVAELKEDEATIDVPAPEAAPTPAPTSEDKAPTKKKTSRKKKKAAKKNSK